MLHDAIQCYLQCTLCQPRVSRPVQWMLHSFAQPARAVGNASLPLIDQALHQPVGPPRPPLPGLPHLTAFAQGCQQLSRCHAACPRGRFKQQLACTTSVLGVIVDCTWTRQVLMPSQTGTYPLTENTHGARIHVCLVWYHPRVSATSGHTSPSMYADMEKARVGRPSSIGLHCSGSTRTTCICHVSVL